MTEEQHPMIGVVQSLKRVARVVEWGDPRSVNEIADAYELSARKSKARRYLDQHDHSGREARRRFVGTVLVALAFLAVSLLLAFALRTSW